ncbi:hypothetical protein ACFQ48_10425 [Hymenobacter caeli]|uniref:DUF3429 domain-containing protein n=1 Tax=Hymenobacter caeli TaxID=2735894 RepID=A0ABX2FRC3_9BACT|nr:hypothetical protein [Hymenobacter caeli]NRT19740.1 hypothetical protein [Hymenobacter caeli]
MSVVKLFRPYVSLVLLLVPPGLFGLLLLLFQDNARLRLGGGFPYLPWQFLVVGAAGTVATLGGVLDWRYHRSPLHLKIPKKERDAEAAALGLGGVPMFVLMGLATLHGNPTAWLIPIVVVLVYTVVAISYDEFVFHRKRCGPVENTYHRMLVFGNGTAWLAWFHFIYC